MQENCIYLKNAIGTTEDGRELRSCDMHSKCVTAGNSSFCASCESCNDKLLLYQSDFASKFLDHLHIVDRYRERTNALRNHLAGIPTFLVCGGPSAKALPLNLLEQRGVFSLAVNNMAGFYRSSAFICADPPSKFHNGIWLDPNVMKFVPIPKLTGSRVRLRSLDGDEFKKLEFDGREIGTTECPNVWGFSRRSWLQTDETFFSENDAAWGNHDSGVRKTGLQKTVMTMLLALRILYYLGSRRVYLVGVDFNMDPMAGPNDNYAFGQTRDAGAIQSNNTQYKVANDWLVTMVQNGIFKKFGMEIFNCNERSGLRAFPYVPFEYAVKNDVLKHYPPQPWNLTGWYEKR